MKNIPKTLKSFEADACIISSTPGRELFRTIFNRFLWKIYRNIDEIDNNVKLDLNIDYLSKITQMNKKTIQRHRAALCEIGLLKVSRSSIEICLNYYLSLINLCSSIDQSLYGNFTALVELHDLDGLNNMGFRYISSDEMKEMIIMLLYPKNGLNTQKWDVTNQTAANTQKWDLTPKNTPYIPKVGSNSQHLEPTFGYYNEESVVNTQKWDVTGDSGNATSQKWDLTIEKICYNIGVNTQKWDVSDLINAITETEKQCEEPTSGYFSQNDVQFLSDGAEKLAKMLEYVSKMGKSYIPKVGIISNFLDPTFTPIIRKNIKEKNIKEINNKDSSDYEGMEPSENFEKNSGGFEIDMVGLNPEKLFENFKQSENSKIGKHTALQDIYSKKPYYSKEEFKNITAPLEPGETVTSPVKLFFYMFWWGLWDIYSENYETEDYDAKGNMVESDEVNDLKMIGAILPAFDISQLLVNTYSNLEGAVEKGVYEDQYGEYKIGFQEIAEFDCLHLINWKQTKLPSGEPGLVISMDGVRDIEAEDTDMPKAPVSKDEIREDRRKSHAMVREIMKSPEEDLTPIELAIRRFLDMFGNFDEYYHMNGFKSTRKMVLPGNARKHIKTETVDNTVEVRKLGKQLFFQPVIEITNETGIDKDLFFEAMTDSASNTKEEINGSGSVFSYTKVAGINMKHKWVSRITAPDGLK